MIINKVSRRTYSDRLSAKKALGGTKGFNEALKRGDLLFPDRCSVRNMTNISKTITGSELTYLLRGYIYVRTLKATGENYVGQTCNINKRNNNWRSVKSPYGGPKINQARSLYGIDENTWDLTLTEIFAPSKKELDHSLDLGEEKMIIRLDAVNKGFNKSYGRGMKGLTHSNESKSKISASMKSYWARKKTAQLHSTAQAA